MAASTTSSHTAPAWARIRLPSTVMPSLASFTAVRSAHVSEITRLEPPANTSTGPPCPARDSASRCPSAATTWSLLVHVTRRRAIGPTRRVVSGASGTESATDAPANTEPAPLDFMARNGSLTCYAAFIRLVGRLRRQC